MTLTQLAYFVRIAELQSLSRAAAVLGVAQPALSRHVRALEAELGAPLFARHAWGVSLTQAGEVLLERARRLLADTESAADAVRALAADPSGRVALGVPASIAVTLLPPLILRLRDKYPKLRPALEDGFSASLHARVVSGDLDMAILYSDRTLGVLTAAPLVAERLVLAGPAHGEVHVSSTAAMLSNHPLILPARPNRLRLIVDEAAFLPCTPPLEVDSLPAIIAMVTSGAGFTVLPYSTIAAEAERGALRVWPLARPQLMRTLAIVHAPDRHASRAVLAVQSEIQGLIHELSSTLGWEPLQPP